VLRIAVRVSCDELFRLQDLRPFPPVPADILTVVTADADSLERLTDLIAGLSTQLRNGDLLGWVNSGDIADVPATVYGVVCNAGLLGEGDPAYPVSVPADPDALMSQLWEVDEPTAIGLLTDLAGGSGTNRRAGPPHLGRLRHRYPDDPQDIFAELANLIGPATRWWTNTDLSTWNQVTQRAFDAVIAGAGNQLIVTLIVFEGGG
jgi:hypothetical protein